MTEGIQTNVSPINWTIASTLETRKNTREQWASDLVSSQTADKIAGVITKDVFSKFHSQISDPYKPLPTNSLPLHLSFSFELEKYNLENLKHLTKDLPVSGGLTSWITKIETTDVNHYHHEKTSSLKIAVTHLNDLDAVYFESKMAEIGRQVERTIQNTLSNFAQNPSNNHFKYKVEWVRKADSKFLSSLSDFRRDNSLHINLWIE